MRLNIDPGTIKGFLDPEEGRALHDAVLGLEVPGPCLEIGSYCGKSALYLGSACRATRRLLFAVDHHRGSEENQPGAPYHDPDLLDPESGLLDTLPALRRTLRLAGLEETVVPVVGRSAAVARHWRTEIALLFIDGGHSLAAALDDYRLWTAHLAHGGVLAIHDVFPDPAEGGRPPFEIYGLALGSGLYGEGRACRSLRLLRRL